MSEHLHVESWRDQNGVRGISLSHVSPCGWDNIVSEWIEKAEDVPTLLARIVEETAKAMSLTGPVQFEGLHPYAAEPEVPAPDPELVERIRSLIEETMR